MVEAWVFTAHGWEKVWTFPWWRCHDMRRLDPEATEAIFDDLDSLYEN